MDLPPEKPPTGPLAAGVGGAERRQSARADVLLPCELDFPNQPFHFKGEILNLSAGGMKIRFPRSVPNEYLSQPFHVSWAMGGHVVRGLVYRIYHYSPSEIAVRFVDSGNVLTSEVARYVFIVLKSQRLKFQIQRSGDAPAEEEGAKPAASRQQRRDTAMKGHLSLGEALVEQRDRHKNPGKKWLDRRIATHLDFD